MNLARDPQGLAFLDALSHSPDWPRTLLIVTKDDPAQGIDSVGDHRTVFVAASPWVKRGYVSHMHADTSSIHKLVAHIFGLPYPNTIVANAALPLDLKCSITRPVCARSLKSARSFWRRRLA